MDNISRCVSFDVKALFTNVPLDTLETILKDRWNEIQAHTSLPKDEFFQLLNFTLRDCNQFIYNDTIYKQTDGIPMGSPLSPILSDIVMEYILDQAISKLNYKLDVCIKYVDDLFLIIPKHLIDYTLAVFNSIHHKIQFTHETEVNNQIPFLDVIVIRNEDGTLDYNWYSKPTSSNRLLNFRSNHPLSHKLNVMDNLIRRVFGLSSKKFHLQNDRTIKQMLVASHYPIKLIEQRIRKFFWKTTSAQRKPPNNTNNSSGNPQQVHFRGIQYNPTCSLNIGKVLCKNTPELRLGYKPSLTNRSIFSKPKQRTLKENLYNVVYHVPCFGDGFNAQCDDCYIGTTGHKVGNRQDQHVGDIKTFNRTNKLDETTAIVHHYYETGHVPDTDNFSILAVEHNYTKRKVLESLNILSHPNSMNFRRDTANISAAYRSLL